MTTSSATGDCAAQIPNVAGAVAPLAELLQARVELARLEGRERRA